MKRYWPANQNCCLLNNSVQAISLSPYPGNYLPQQSLSRFKIFLLTLGLLFSVIAVFGQADAEQDAAYKKVIHDRVTKFIDPMNITDQATHNKVVEIVSQRYYTINSVHEKNKAVVAAIRSQNISNEEKDALIKKEDDNRLAVLKEGHDAFLADLQQAKLSAEQIDKIKDGMTYSVLHVTYDAYVDMIPRLTTEQKEKIYAWLVEARELAMDGESSDKKHQIFGKYKGRINNYLSSLGFDMKKEEDAWRVRLKERREMAKQAESK